MSIANIPTGLPTTFTTPHGECPPSDRLFCPDYCDSIQACVSVERGQCFYPLSAGFTVNDGFGVNAERQLFCINIRIQNCTEHDIKLTSAQLNFLNRLIGVQDDGVELVLGIGIGGLQDNKFEPEKNDPVIVGGEQSTMMLDIRVLSLESTCGTPNLFIDLNNPGYTAGFSGFGAPGIDDNLLRGTTNIPPGECCIKLVVAVTLARGGPNGFDSNIQDVLLERACLVLKGRQSLGGACCRWQRSLLLPADCPLREERGTEPPVNNIVIP